MLEEENKDSFAINIPKNHQIWKLLLMVDNLFIMVIGAQNRWNGGEKSLFNLISYVGTYGVQLTTTW